MLDSQRNLLLGMDGIATKIKSFGGTGYVKQFYGAEDLANLLYVFYIREYIRRCIAWHEGKTYSRTINEIERVYGISKHDSICMDDITYRFAVQVYQEINKLIIEKSHRIRFDLSNYMRFDAGLFFEILMHFNRLICNKNGGLNIYLITDEALFEHKYGKYKRIEDLTVADFKWYFGYGWVYARHWDFEYVEKSDRIVLYKHHYKAKGVKYKHIVKMLGDEHYRIVGFKNILSVLRRIVTDEESIIDDSGLIRNFYELWYFRISQYDYFLKYYDLDINRLVVNDYEVVKNYAVILELASIFNDYMELEREGLLDKLLGFRYINCDNTCKLEGKEKEMLNAFISGETTELKDGDGKTYHFTFI